MTEAISQFFANSFGGNVLLATFLISFLPLMELKGAIPFGMSVAFWQENALTAWQALGIAFLGSSLVVPFVALVFKPFINWLSKFKFFGGIINFFTGDIKAKSEIVVAQSGKSKTRSLCLKMLSVTLFVAFPIPLTGVWTGTCLAVMLGLNFWQTCLSTIFGNFICGLIVILICDLFPNSIAIILYVFLAFVVVALAAKIVLHFVKKNRGSGDHVNG
jgi:uncharacterized membrane protein